MDTAVLSSDNEGTKDLAIEHRTRALEGAAVGAAAGAFVGAALAWFASSPNVSISNVGPLITMGPVLAALAGAGAGGALGWILGLLIGVCLPEYVAKRYVGRIRHGGILMSVHCDSQEWCERAKKTLKSTGARGISSASESAADYGTTGQPTERAPTTILDRDAGEAYPPANSVAHETKE